ncbi:unnamed protein product, partial [Vitis vinifera]|uniref:Uncharacterized protein n=1 Tax=Vitis vinifera TaxID=29760 RepID=D7UDZ2_VITVI
MARHTFTNFSIQKPFHQNLSTRPNHSRPGRRDAFSPQPPPCASADQFSAEFCYFISACVQKDPLRPRLSLSAASRLSSSNAAPPPPNPAAAPSPLHARRVLHSAGASRPESTRSRSLRRRRRCNIL